MQMTYDVGAGALVDIRVGDAHLSETLQGLPLAEGDVVLNDRGFTRRTGIAAVASLQAYQLGRWLQTGARLQHEDGSTLNIDAWLESIEAECSIAERPGQCEFNKQIVPERVLALRLPPEQAKKVQERLRKCAARESATRPPMGRGGRHLKRRGSTLTRSGSSPPLSVSVLCSTFTQRAQPLGHFLLFDPVAASHCARPMEVAARAHLLVSPRSFLLSQS